MDVIKNKKRRKVFVLTLHFPCCRGAVAGSSMTGQRSRLPLFETLGTARCCSVDLAHTFTHRTLAIHRLTLIIRAPKAVVEVPASKAGGGEMQMHFFAFFCISRSQWFFAYFAFFLHFFAYVLPSVSF